MHIALKIFLWIFGVGGILAIAAFTYFWFFFSFEAPVSICISEDNITRSDISCTSDVSCRSVFTEQARQMLGADDSSELEGVPPELVERFLTEVMTKAVSCDEVCLIRDVTFSEETGCSSEQERVPLILKGREAVAIAKGLWLAQKEA